MSFWSVPSALLPAKVRTRRRRRVALASIVLVALSVVAPISFSGAARAADPDGMHLKKTVSATTVAPLEQFHFDLTYDCFSNTGPCVDAKIVDTLPAELEIVQVAPLDASTPGTVTTVGNTVTATFTKPLAGGGVGLDEGSTGTLVIIARFKDRTVAQGGTTVTNTAQMTAVGHDPAQSSVDVSVVVDTRVAAKATKTWAASTSGVGGKNEVAQPGAAKAVTLGFASAANIPAQTITLREPRDPAATPAAGSAFDVLDLTRLRLGDVTAPPGATSLVVTRYPGATDYTVDLTAGLPATTDLLDGADPSTVTGLTLAFTGDFAPGAAGTLDLATTQRAHPRSNPAGATTGTVGNQIGVQVGADSGGSPVTSPVATADDTFALVAPALVATTTKSFNPTTVPLAGQRSTATITGTNASNVPVTTLTLADPASGGDQVFGDNALHLVGFGTDGAGAGVHWPTGATSATVTLTYQDTSTESRSSSTADTLPAAADFTGSFADVVGFEVTFTGPAGAIGVNAKATVPYQVTAGPNATAGPQKNCATATVTTGALAPGQSAPICATLTLVQPTVRVDAGKRLTTDQVSTSAGSQVTAVLTANAHVGGGAGNGNTKPTELGVEDTASANARWWQVFQPVAIHATPVADGDTLRVQYTTDGGTTWTTYDTVTGPTLYSADLSGQAWASTANGIRLVTTRPGGFPDGQGVQGNITFAVRAAPTGGGPFADHEPVTNCSRSTAGLAGFPAVTGSATSPSCPQVEGLAGLDGTGAPLSKTVGQKLVTEGSQQTVPLTLAWGTNGRSDLDRVTVSDEADGVAAVPTGQDSFWDAFDLQSIAPITSGPTRSGTNAYDPYLVFDQVTAVEYYDVTDSTWKAVPGVCTTPCVGSFPGVTAAQLSGIRERVGGFRLVYAPRADRAAVLASLQAAGDWRTAISPTGTGVAAVPDGNHQREVKATARLRDTLRSQPTVPVNDARYYNAGACKGVVPPVATLPCTGQVVDDGTVSAAVGAGAPTLLGSGHSGTVAADRTVTILPMVLALDGTKTWLRANAFGQRPHDLGLPVDGTNPADYPSAVLTVTGTNNTAAARVSTMTIVEPQTVTGGASDPFSVFDITALTTTPPAGTTSTQVFLNDGSGFGAAATPAQLADPAVLAATVQVKVVFEGALTTGASGTLTLTTRLRATNRVTGDPPSPTAAGSPIQNTAAFALSDPRVCQPDGANEDAYPDPCPRAAVTDTDDDYLTLSGRSLDVQVGKTISPTTVNRESVPATPVEVRLQVQNTGNSDADTLTLLDAAEVPAADLPTTGTFPAGTASPTFFDAITVDGLKLTQYPTGATRVRLDVLTGSVFTGTPGGSLTAAGGTWHQGSFSAVPVGSALTPPAGVAWADVVGVRVVFQGTGPLASPGDLGTLTLTGHLRTTLRSGGRPSADGGAPAEINDTVANPGETVVGRIGNQVGARADSVDGLSSGTPTATDSLQVNAGTVAVAVKKTPVGDVLPGAVVPFELTVRNTGTADVLDPVVVDQLPTDARGEQLVLDPTVTTAAAGGGDQPWSVTGTGGSPASLGAVESLRHNDTDGPVTIDGVLVPAHSVLVRWAPGAVLHPGDSLTVHLPLQVRPDVLGPVDNAFGVTSDSADHYLTGPGCTGLDGAGTTYQPTDRSCWTTAPMTVLMSGAFTSVKDVRAWPANLGAVNTVDPNAPCASDASGYVAYPCVAYVAPGGKMRWRTKVRAGNVAADSLVLVDVLPHVGDVGEQSHAPRYSKWRPVWDGVTPTLDPDFANPAGTTMTVLYSTAANPSVDYDGTPGGDWSATPPADPADLTAFAFVLDFSGTTGLYAGKLSPGDSVRIAWTMDAPYDQHADSWGGTDAWNTFGFQGQSDRSYVSQPRKAGVRLAESQVTVTKTVQDDTALGVANGATFTARVDCTVPADPTDPGGPTAPVVLPAGGVVTLSPSTTPAYRAVVDHVPVGATCSVTETDTQGASTVEYGFDATTVVADPAGMQNLLPITNTFAAADLVVTKKADAAAGQLPGGTTFPVTVDCTLDGAALTLAPADASFTLAPDATHTVAGLPVGASCTVTETDSGDAVAEYQVGAGAATATPAVVTLGSVPASNTVTVTNRYPNVSIDKSHTGGAVAIGGTVTFTITVTNHGPGPVNDVVVSDAVPASLSSVTVAGATGGWLPCTNGPPVTCKLGGPLAAGDSATITVTGTVTAAAYPAVVNTASVTTSTPQTRTDDDTDTDTVPVTPSVDLTLTKTASAGSFTVGTPAAYRLVVGNQGRTPTSGQVTVTDTLPAGITFRSASGASCTATGQTVTCLLAGGLAVGETRTITLNVDVRPAAAPGVTNCAAVSGTDADTDQANNQDCVTVRVDVPPTTPTTKPTKPTPPTPGATHPGKPGGQVEGTGAGRLPWTGAMGVPAALAAGLLFLLVGAVLVRARRRP